jgi:drug/metabolite transporter (DMT)-like permease
MIYLISSIVSASYLILAFKFFERYKIDLFQTIVINYIVCVFTGALFEQIVPDYGNWIHSKWFWNAAILGCSFIFFFNVMGFITTHQGITVTSIANKLSLVITVAFSFYLYDEKITTLKIIGICLSLAAVVLSSIKDHGHDTQFNIKLLFWPLLLFLGSGMNDSLVKYAQVKLLQESEFNNYNIVIFSFAAAIGALILLYRIFIQHKAFDIKAIPAGIILGIPNYFSIYFLLKTLKLPGWESSVIFPINNIGVVAFSAIMAFVLFKERMSRLNLIGLVLALAAILIMAYAV